MSEAICSSLACFASMLTIQTRWLGKGVCFWDPNMSTEVSGGLRSCEEGPLQAAAGQQALLQGGLVSGCDERVVLSSFGRPPFW